MMSHTNRVSDSIFDNRIEGTTQPWLGTNMYAENRILPHVPWKPSETYKQAPPVPKIEEPPQEEVQPKIMKKTPVKGWSQKEESKSTNEVTNEFNILAGLIVDCANDVE